MRPESVSHRLGIRGAAAVGCDGQIYKGEPTGLGGRLDGARGGLIRPVFKVRTVSDQGFKSHLRERRYIGSLNLAGDGEFFS